MKPLHIGLLVIGAALAGGLAVKMTQPPAYPVAAQSAISSLPAPAPPPVPTPEPAAAQPSSEPIPAVTAAPAAVYQPEKTKQKPVPRVAVKSAPEHTQERTAENHAPPSPSPAEIAKIELPVKPPVPYQAPAEPPAQTAPAPAAHVEPQPDPAPAPPPLRVTLNQGTQIVVRLDQAISSDRMSPGDTFQASLAEPLVADGYIIAEKGARVSGRVVDSRQAGRLSGTSELQLALNTLQTADGQKIAISTDPWVKQGSSSRNQDVAKIGGGAALGAIIGAIAGGGKGAAIGAGVGGAAGTGAAAAAKGKAATIPSETVIRFRLNSLVSVTERRL